MESEKNKILIIDDTQENLQVAGKAVSSLGYIVLYATSGDEGILIAKNYSPDLILLDIRMPNKDGFEVISILKKDSITKDIPIIFLTALTEKKDLLKGFKLGAVDYISKPFVSAELISRVRAQINIVNNNKIIKKYSLELKSLNEKLESQNIFLSRLLENIPSGIVIYKKNGKILMYNTAFQSILKFSDKIDNYFKLEHMDSAFRKEQIRDKKIRLNTKVQYEIESESPQQLTLLVTKTMVNIGKSKLIICSLTDISEIKNLQKSIIEKNKDELTKSQYRIEHFSNFNKKMYTKTKSLKQNFQTEGLATIVKDMLIEFEKFEKSSLWEDFEFRFANVHTNFIEKLKEAHPTLTHTEVKLCSMIRLGLSSKEISHLSQQLPTTIDMARYRLRKKLNFSKNDHLYDYLYNI